MATAAPARPQATPVHYAGFWIRFVAAFIDGIIVGIANAVVGTVMGLGSPRVTPGMQPAEMIPILIASMSRGFFTGLIIGVLYYALLESSEKQATLGKMIVGIKVTDENGQRISFARAAGRFFAKYISALILLIGYIMAAFTDRKRALHDMIAGTLVMYSK